jgi:hypothetical protein
VDRWGGPEAKKGSAITPVDNHSVGRLRHRFLSDPEPGLRHRKTSRDSAENGQGGEHEFQPAAHEVHHRIA